MVRTSLSPHPSGAAGASTAALDHRSCPTVRTPQPMPPPPSSLSTAVPGETLLSSPFQESVVLRSCSYRHRPPRHPRALGAVTDRGCSHRTNGMGRVGHQAGPAGRGLESKVGPTLCTIFSGFQFRLHF
jgi:hypothetical protein